MLVTGASAGIGRAIAEEFAARGAGVVAHVLTRASPVGPGTTVEHHTADAASVAGLAGELRAAGARAARVLEADLSIPGEPERLVTTAVEEFGAVHVLVNNAAHCESPDDILSVSREGMARHHGVNAIAPALMVAEMARRHRPGGTAAVVNISTDAAPAFGGQIGYGTSKAALEAFTRAAALDLGPSGIRVNAVAPGPVQTGWMSEDLVREVEPTIPLRRVGFPEDIAEAVVFLASDAAGWITGQVLRVAGGHVV
ncbi:SDR family oxidoreductase [Streptomyces calidiresistens]